MLLWGNENVWSSIIEPVDGLIQALLLKADPRAICIRDGPTSPPTSQYLREQHTEACENYRPRSPEPRLFKYSSYSRGTSEFIGQKYCQI